MQNQHIGTSGMDQDNLLAHDDAYANQSWVNMNNFSQGHMAGYDNFNYLPPVTHAMSSEAIGNSMPPVSHGLPSESVVRMPPPLQPLRSRPPSNPPMPRPMLNTSFPLPSQLLPGSSGSFSAPVGMPPPMVETQSPPQVKVKAKTGGRKALSVEAKKRMCEMAENNPTMKQTEIGKHFNVERSTVSKVLRQKEKFLNPDGRKTPDMRRDKTKADLDRGLMNYIANERRAGRRVTDDQMLEKARAFAHGLGPKVEPNVNYDMNWVQDFKNRNSLVPGKLTRRASETNITDRAMNMNSPSLTPPQMHSGVSPASPTGQPSPMSGNRSDEDPTDPMASGGYMGFSSDGGHTYRHTNNQSTTSLSSVFTDGNSSFSGSALSPTAPFTFSPDANLGSFMPQDQHRGHHHHHGLDGGIASNFQRPRSQTFPNLDLDAMNQQMKEPQTPKFQPSITAPSSALDSPMADAPPPYSLDTSVGEARALHRSSSSSSMGRVGSGIGTMGGIPGSSLASTPLGSTPTSPTQEEARRAGDTLLSYIQHTNGMINQDEYNTVLRVVEKLQLHLHQGSSSSGGFSGGLGRLTRIPENDIEMPPVSMPTKA